MKTTIIVNLLIICLLHITIGVTGQNQEEKIRIGLIADIQYCDCETRGSRHYQKSLAKLDTAVSIMNQHKLHFIVDLGDRIDTHYSSFMPVEKILSKSVNPVIFVPGNHDFSVDPSHLSEVVKKTGSLKGYHVKVIDHWRFIFLHGLKQSIPATQENSDERKKAESQLKELKEAGVSYAYDWNGGLGEEQFNWLTSQIQSAESAGQNLILFCHQPVNEDNAHNLWEAVAVRKILKDYPGSVFWINGHDHRGGMEQIGNLSNITIHGMVEQDTYSFAIMEIAHDTVSIEGFGRQPDLHPGG